MPYLSNWVMINHLWLTPRRLSCGGTFLSGHMVSHEDSSSFVHRIPSRCSELLILEPSPKKPKKLWFASPIIVHQHPPNIWTFSLSDSSRFAFKSILTWEDVPRKDYITACNPSFFVSPFLGYISYHHTRMLGHPGFALSTIIYGLSGLSAFAVIPTFLEAEIGQPYDGFFQAPYITPAWVFMIESPSILLCGRNGCWKLAFSGAETDSTSCGSITCRYQTQTLLTS